MFHITNTEALLGWVLLAIGGVLLIWACLRPKEPRPKPQPRDVFPPLFDLDEANDKPALKVSVIRKTPAGKRDINGRLHGADGGFLPKG